MTPSPLRKLATLPLLLACMHAWARAEPCKAPPPAAIDIDANSYYSDRNHSIVDPVLKARNVANTRPTNDFLDVVARAASVYHGAPRERSAEAQCALAWLSSWAAQGAMLGKMTTSQSYYQRKWTLSGLALSYAKLKPAAAKAERQQIEAWLTRLADATMAHSERPTGARNDRARNNHYYWEGLAVTAAGAVTGEARHLAWGRKVFDAAMAQVAADGSLPREMERAVKALHYHLFAATPLVMMASILDVQSTRLDQLMQFTLKSAADPSYIERKTGFVQERADAAQGWTVIYARHTRGAGAAGAAVPGTARNWQPRLGGDLWQVNPLEHVAGKAMPSDEAGADKLF